MNVTVSNESGRSCDTSALEHLAVHLLAALRLHPECELGITLVDIDRMTGLHEDWMNEPGPTDVLSFPIDELRAPDAGEAAAQGILGDIVLCPDFLAPQAERASRSLDEELQFLTAHGVLHLIGYDHQTPDDYAAMFALQDRLLAGWADV
jgi:probable rRNA maturation factor